MRCKRIVYHRTTVGLICKLYEHCNYMPPITDLPPAPDSAGMALVWGLIQGIANSASHAQAPTEENGWGVAIKVLIILLALLVLAILGLCGAVLLIFRRWERGQAKGIEALSQNKDSTKREITGLLKSELGNSRAANAADTAEIKAILTEHAKLLGFIVLDLVVLAQKAKVQLRSSPIHVNKKED